MNSVSVTTLQEWIPHRPPMIWIDTLESFSEAGGACTLTIRSTANYMSRGRLRPSSLIEMMAQAHAFISIAHFKQTAATTITKAFLVAIKDAHLASGKDLNVPDGTELHIFVEGVRLLGPIHMFQGRVMRADTGQELARAHLRVYAELSG